MNFTYQYNKADERGDKLMLLLNTVSGGPLPNGPKKKRTGLKIALSLFVVLLAVLIFGYTYIKSALGPLNSEKEQDITVMISQGSSINDIGDQLEKKGVIKSSTIFAWYAKYKNESNLKAGTYDFTTGMDADQILSVLTEGKEGMRHHVSITIPEGFTVPKVAKVIAKQTGQSEESVLQVMNDRAFVKELQGKYPIIDKKVFNKKIYYPLEGYLFPAKYVFNTKKTSVKEIVTRMVAKTENVLDLYKKDMKDMKKTPYQLLTMAAIVEGEAQADQDRGKIAGVFYNRIKKQIPLGSDPTVKYARKNFKVKLLYKELKIDSPYNTYKYKGLPIGPINSPGEPSIKAALHPEKSDYLFFYARPSGEVIYTKNFADHQKAINRYKSEWKKHEEQG
ncbi:aminodeoxychorismate lyase [Fictibacillus macauensis ZFHKF-1]|uniref:Endolytic murein transglycosylase n=1 Tax=Fictibacillus macauensis ZFHKF-1 TaxID=1196324 RepID=I8AIH8_9BACL|nr:endolytic transglycosylase MltG [Fictibacillus macauensis]EIT85284.1 aminodeoxychorismate lyase [Fictibacillus macauensis ZFHKF-1]